MTKRKALKTVYQPRIDQMIIQEKRESMRILPLYSVDKSHKYYNIVKEFNAYQFVSDTGNLISVFRQEPLFIKPNFDDETGREGYDITVKHNGHLLRLWMQPAAIVNLAFEGKATDNAKLLMDEFGLDALHKLSRAELKALYKKKGVSDKARLMVKLLLDKGWDTYQLVQINHEKGFAVKDTKEDAAVKRAENCDLSASQFEYTLEHILLTHAPDKKASNKEVITYFSNSIDLFHDHPVVIAPFVEKAGTIIDGFSDPSLESTDFGELGLHLDEIKLAGICYKANLMLKYDDGTNLEKGINVSNVDYMYFDEKYRTFLTEFGVPTNAYLGQSIDNKDVYGFYEVV